MKKGKPIVIAYDISRNKIRRRIYKIIRAWRLDGQKSVHECLLTMNQAQELFIQLGEPLELKTDSLMMAWIEPHRKVLYRGIGRKVAPNNLWHIG